LFGRIIRKVVSKEQQYLRDLDLIESVRSFPSGSFLYTDMFVMQIFIIPLRKASPPVIPHSRLGPFIRDVFGDVLSLREPNRRLIDAMSKRQRDQGEVISKVGDIFIQAVADFESVYPACIGHLPLGEIALKDEMENNAELRLFLEVCTSSWSFGSSVELMMMSAMCENTRKYT
jgi:hypothetical protein